MFLRFYRTAQLLHKINTGKLKRCVDQRSFFRLDLAEIRLTHNFVKIHFNLFTSVIPHQGIYTNSVKKAVHSREILFLIFHSHKQDFIIQLLFAKLLQCLFLGKKPCLIIISLFCAGHIRKLCHLRICHKDAVSGLNFLHCVYYTYSHSCCPFHCLSPAPGGTEEQILLFISSGILRFRQVPPSDPSSEKISQ